MTSLSIAPKLQTVTHGTVSAELRHLHMFASKDEHRHSLTYVMVRKQGDGWQACAIDGHRLAVVTLPAGSITSDVDQFYIPATLLAKVKLKRDETAAFDIDDGLVRVVCSSGVTLTECCEQADIGGYPDIDRVILPTSTKHASVWGINPDYLWEAGDYARKVSGDKRVGIAIHAPSDDASPMRVTCGAVSGYVCIIMPMHL